MPHGNPILGELAEPAALEPVLHLGGPRIVRKQHAGLSSGRAKREHLPHMGIGSPLLGQQVVAVVPERDQTEIMNRCIRGCPVADHHQHFSAQSRQESPVPRCRSGFCHQYCKAAGTEHLRTGFAETIKISLVRTQ